MYKNILYETENGRARIILNRPQKRNALSGELLRELRDALWEADDDTSIHAVVLKGAGSCFSSGHDLSPGKEERTPGKSYRANRDLDDEIWEMTQQQRCKLTLFDMHKPVIAQVHGYCIAGATDIALLCDMVIAADDAIFAVTPARLMAALPTQMWLYHLGPQRAKRLLLTGDSITGKEAEAIGLALKSVPLAQLDAEVEGLLDKMAQIDPAVLAANKRIVNLGLEMMGARTMQRIAVENNARSRRSPTAEKLGRDMREKGLKQALRAGGGRFGDAAAESED
ncbi:MAG: crotonase/enoyl-CoA hydratase family protein [Pseudomonadota bacterium]